MTISPRFVAGTLNLWADARWNDRLAAVQGFIRGHMPDILAVQELRPVSQQLLDREMPDHQRVEDPFAGWHEEGNVYWCQDLFELVEYGAEDVGILGDLRRLFWVRLMFRDEVGTSLLVATAHYTWPGHRRERQTGQNPRLEQARRTATTLTGLGRPDEPLLFMGDLNDFQHPLRILRERGFEDAFSALGRKSPVTRPSGPKGYEAEAQVNDWILHRGPIRPMAADVVDYFANDLPPSDHKPVLVTYRLL